ncbi:MAG: virulence RhuM family protein [Crocinitomicaceae bacterium]|nr:virulence RhuM family protein [Crocinitomicaceae bacterium]
MDEKTIITYQSASTSNQIEVRIEDETVWLNRNQIAILFDRDIKTIGKHINNAIKEELSGVSVVANFATTAKDGKVYQVAYYNLDMILSVGYRVKSSKGIEFRKWSSAILKSYLLKGYALQNRVEAIEKRVYEQEFKIEQLLLTNLPVQQGIFFDGQLFDAYVFVSDLVKSAKKSIVLIDNYVDETVLLLLSKRNANVKATIYTEKITPQFQLDIQKHNAQYEPVGVEIEKKSHDRFLIIDENQVYHIGASIKDLGKKWFAFSRLHIDANSILSRL